MKNCIILLLSLICFTSVAQSYYTETVVDLREYQNKPFNGKSNSLVKCLMNQAESKNLNLYSSWTVDRFRKVQLRDFKRAIEVPGYGDAPVEYYLPSDLYIIGLIDSINGDSYHRIGLRLFIPSDHPMNISGKQISVAKFRFSELNNIPELAEQVNWTHQLNSDESTSYVKALSLENKQYAAHSYRVLGVSSNGRYEEILKTRKIDYLSADFSFMKKLVPEAGIGMFGTLPITAKTFSKEFVLEEVFWSSSKKDDGFFKVAPLAIDLVTSGKIQASGYNVYDEIIGELSKKEVDSILETHKEILGKDFENVTFSIISSIKINNKKELERTIVEISVWVILGENDVYNSYTNSAPWPIKQRLFSIQYVDIEKTISKGRYHVYDTSDKKKIKMTTCLENRVYESATMVIKDNHGYIATCFLQEGGVYAINSGYDRNNTCVQKIDKETIETIKDKNACNYFIHLLKGLLY